MGISPKHSEPQEKGMVEINAEKGKNDDNKTAVNSSPVKTKKRISPNQIDRCTRTPKKTNGLKHMRRLDNLQYLLNLADEEEATEWELTCLVEQKNSPFSNLFTDDGSMQVWNDFINHTEEQQQHFLCNLSYGETRAESVIQDWEQVKSRNDHPAYTAKQCFQRIDNKFKTVLLKKHLPLGALSYLEEEVTSFFEEWPTSVLVSGLGSSYERLLLHALCQYLDLTSHSFNSDVGKRQTQVENKHEYFAVPCTRLTEYLDSCH